jgi:hypothetical protein
VRRGLAVATFLVTWGLGDAHGEDGRAAQALQPGAMGIEVGVNTFDLGTPSSGVLAVRRQLSQPWGARLSIGFGTSQSDATLAEAQGSEVFLGTTSSESHRIDVGAQVLWFPVQAGNCALSFAAGPGYFAGRSVNDREDIEASGTYRIMRTTESTSHGFSATLDAGFDWFVDRRVALRARSGTAFSWTHGSDIFQSTAYDESGNVTNQVAAQRETDGTGFSTLSFGLSLIGYF